MASRAIHGPQGELAVQDSGAGNALPLVFLHADAGRASQWSEVSTSIGAHRRVISFDFRGHGESSPAANGDYSFSGRADDVAAVVDALSLPRFVIVAHSGGAATALAFASTHQDRIAGILMIDPPTDSRTLPREVRDKYVADLAGPHGLDVIRGFYTSIAGPNATIRQRVLADVELVAPAARLGVGKALAEWIPDATLRAFRGPMRILATPPNDTPAALYRLRPDIPHEIVSPSGHWMQLDQPRIVENAITAFVTSVEHDSASDDAAAH